MKEIYCSIINLPHYRSSKRPHMSADSRAAQFAPYAALSGYEDTIRETAKETETEPKREPDEASETRINDTLNLIKDHIREKPEINITYFVRYKSGQGGRYVTAARTVQSIDECGGKLIFTDGKRVDFADIYDINVML